MTKSQVGVRRVVPHWAFVLGILLVIGAWSLGATPPNIVFILADDMGWRDQGFSGSTFYETPNLDRLAKEGMRFTNAYAACPVCSPTRASILTGKYPARVGVTDFIGEKAAAGRLLSAPYTHYLPTSEFTLAEALHEGGYVTWHVGKWHLGSKEYWPEKQGFDVNIGGTGQGHPPTYFSPYRIETLPDGPKGEYLTDRLTEEVVKLIKGNAKSGKPFYLNFCEYAVHTPIQAPAELVKKYEEKAKRLGLDQEKVLEEGEAFPTIAKRDRRVQRRLVQSHPAYAAMMETFDNSVGGVMKALEEAGVAENTIVIFTSDNGGLSTAEGSPTSNLPARDGKGWLYEGGVKEPLVVRWPGHVKAGSVCEAVVTSPDFYPTLVEAAGLPDRPEQAVDGVSLTPLLGGAKDIKRDAIFWHYPHYGNQGGTPGSAMREGDWKLIEFFEDGRLELYNLKEDPGEKKDMANAEAGRAKEMHEKLVKWRESVGGKIPERNPGWRN